MRRTRLIQLALLCLLAFAAPSQSAPANPRLAVLPLDSSSERWSPSDELAAEETIVAKLAASARFRVLDREVSGASLREKNLSLPSKLDPQTAILAGQLIGADYLLTGSITDEPASPTARDSKTVVSVSLRLMDAKTGAIVWADEKRQERSADAQRSAAGDRDVESMLEQLAASLAAVDL